MDTEELYGHRGVGAIRVGAFVLKVVDAGDLLHALELEAYERGGVRVPRTLAHAALGAGAYQVVRRYVAGATAAAAAPALLREAAGLLLEWVRGNVSGPARALPMGAIRARLQRVRDSAIRPFVPLTTAQEKTIIQSCDAFERRFLHRKATPLSAPEGFAHGDLTLENVVVDSSGAPHLIDPRAPLAGSPIFDLAKLRQCTRYGWSRREEGGVQSLAWLDEMVLETAERMRVDKEALLAVEWLTILRIAPYITTPPTAAWVCAALQEVERCP